MIVLSLLYPIVFIFGLLVGTPILMGKLQLPFFVALFIGNVVSVTLLNYAVPFISKYLGWWLQPSSSEQRAVNLAGAGLMIVLYLLCLVIFSQL